MSLPFEPPSEDQCGMILRHILFCPSQERTVRELDAMDSATRQQVWSDMTGYAAAMEQTQPSVSQEMLNRLLQELTDLLQQPGQKGREAFDAAILQNPQWMEREKIKFLRACNFDVATTADHILRCFKLKEELFGREKLGRDIRLSDLNEDDLACLRLEPMYLLPRTDHVGRPVFFTRPSNFVYKEHSNMLRAFWYRLQTAVEDETTRQAGYVCVAYEINSLPTNFDFELTRQLLHLQRLVPFRVCSLYLCFSAPAWEKVLDVVCHLMSLRGRVRSRTLQGSTQECLYQLMALGIPVKDFPIAQNGDVTPYLSMDWIEKQYRKELEEQSQCGRT